jgi:TatD DNase family protein
MIETHAHIYDPQYDEDREEMLSRAWKGGIRQIWMPNCDSGTLPEMLKLSTQYPDKCLPMLGLHPCYVKEDFESELRLLETHLDAHPFIAIGEIGMDLYWDKTFRKQQEEAFIIQCQWALERELWIDIHSRSAFMETVALIEKIGDSRLKGIFHCFSGTLEEANIAVELGFKLGIGGVVTFKNGGLDKIIPHIDPEHIVLETDSPYLAPVPFRGKRNEVIYIDYVAQRVADLWQMPKQRAIDITRQNALNLIEKNIKVTKA